MAFNIPNIIPIFILFDFVDDKKKNLTSQQAMTLFQRFKNVVDVRTKLYQRPNDVACLEWPTF